MNRHQPSRRVVVGTLGAAGALGLALTGCTAHPAARTVAASRTSPATNSPAAVAVTPPATAPSVAAPPQAPAVRRTSAALAGAPVPPAITSGTADCQVRDLSVRAYGVDNFAGGYVAGYALRNTAAHPCRLSGYVVAQFADAGGRPLPTVVVRRGVAGGPFTVAPGGSGYFEVGIHHVYVGGEGAPCDPPAAALVVGLPGDPGHLAIAAVWRACDPDGQIELGALTAAPDPNLHQ